MSSRSEGRHRVADGAAAETPSDQAEAGSTPLLPAGPAGRFTVQLLDDQWFVGGPGAAQRIENAAWLDAWLTANGSSGHADLDFAGDDALRERFAAELGAGSPNPRPARSPQHHHDTNHDTNLDTMGDRE